MRRVAIAGATGFVGRALCQRLENSFEVVGLTRNAASAFRKYPHLNVEWRSCDLFSLRDAESALRDVDFAVYLVHSMAPAARLTQASFDDLDLILADNFGRAAASADVKQLVYLGGIIPDREELSKHLRSRLEVEQALSQHGVPLTTVRAGLVMGAGGSSFDMLLKLVRRLPVLALPAWTRTPMSPISLDDIITIISRSVGNERTFGVTGDAGSDEPITYEDLLRGTAHALERKRLFLKVPFLSPKLSKGWVKLITGSPSELVAPLVGSLKCPMVARRFELMDTVGVQPRPAMETLQIAIGDQLALERGDVKELPAPPASARKTRPGMDTTQHLTVQAQVRERSRKEVRSVQRLSSVPDQNARWIAREYQAWLPRAMRPFINVRTEENVVRFHAFILRKPLLELSLDLDRSPADRPLFYITGGVLADTSQSLRGRLEFRSVLNGRSVLAAIHEFTPAMPWFLYRWTQAIVHAIVMWFFGRHLKAIADGERDPDSAQRRDS